MSKEAMKLALEFCEFLWREVLLNDWAEGQREAVEQALRAALAEPEQEPDGISWLKRDSGYFTAPTPRQWVGLTDEEIDVGLCRSPYALQTAQAWRDGVEWAQEQLKEKNT